MSKPRIVVLISGTGRNLQAFIDAQANGQLNADIVAVISNKAKAFGLQRAQQAGIDTAVVSHRDYADRELFDKTLANTIDQYQPDLVILAGFMRILTAGFVNHYLGRMLNIHPSLLPKYPGLNTHQRALDAGDNQHGATVHFVTAELDGGPAVIQGRIDVVSGDTPNSLAARLMDTELHIYPLAAEWFCQSRLQFNGSQAVLDQELLHAPKLYSNGIA